MNQSFRTRSPSLLGGSDPEPATVMNSGSVTPVAFICEHAGQSIPAGLGDLGLAEGDIDKHVGWDVGAGQVTRLLADHFRAPAAFQNYSRLVIDCNRPPKAADSTPVISHGVAVPGNENLTAIDHWLRVAEIFVPFQDAVDTILDHPGRRLAVSIHSFEPVLGGAMRPWDIGFLHRHDRVTSALLKKAMDSRRPDLNAGLNQPYTIDDESDLFVPYHGEARGIAHVLVEIRNDHLRTGEGCEAWAALLHDCINDILPEITS